MAKERASLSSALAASVAAYMLARYATPAVGRVLRGAGLTRRRRADGVEIPTAAGLVPVVAGLWAESVVDGGRRRPAAGRLPAIAGALAGVVDDAGRTPGPRGWRQHWRYLWEGRPSTGILKAALISLAAAGCAARQVRERGAARSALTFASTVLAANALNQLDTAPSRALSAYLAGFGLIGLAAGREGRWLWMADLPMAAAVLGFIPFDRRGEVMLGDAGASALGAALGWTAGESLSGRGLLAWTAALLALNVALDRWSLSRFLDGPFERRRGGAIPLRVRQGRTRAEAKMPLPG